MQIVAAQELKRRGLAALDGLLESGPIHIVRNNRAACVVLSPAAYEELVNRAADLPVVVQREDVWSLLLSEGPRPFGTRERTSIDADLAADRAGWDRD